MSKKKVVGPIEAIFRKAALIVDKGEEGCCAAIEEITGTCTSRAQELFEEYFKPLPIAKGQGFVMFANAVEVEQSDGYFMCASDDEFYASGRHGDKAITAELQGRRQTALLFMAEIAAEGGL